MANRNGLKVVQLDRLAPGTHTDLHGLALRITPQGGKQWIQKITLAGRQISLGLGTLDNVNLGQARDRAIENYQLARSGVDPRKPKEMAQQVAEAVAAAPPATAPPLKELAAEVIAFKSNAWKSTRHKTQWEECLRLHAYPMLGDRPVNEISRNDVMDVLTPMWHTKGETSRRVLQRLTTVMDWAVVKGFREDNPCYRLSLMLGKHQQVKKPHRSIPYAELPKALAAVQCGKSAVEVKMAFTYLVLTAGRTGEVLGARWAEIDWEKKLWTIPADRMKNSRPHTVPLSRQSIAVMELARELQGYKGIKDKWEYIFPSRRAKGGHGPLSKMALEMCMRREGLDGTPHGIRSGFATWAAEVPEAREVVVEAALSHTRRQRESLGYDRATHLPERTELLQTWGDFVYPQAR